MTHPLRRAGIGLGLALLAFLSLPAAASSQPLTSTDITDILNSHNEARAAVNSPDSMQALAWDKNLAAVAQRFANLHNFRHNAQRTRQYRARGGSARYVGENLAAQSGETSVAALVGLWVAEGRSFNAAANTCNVAVCGHYTQVVWADTSAVGCGRAAITSPFAGTMLVCDYAPGGNLRGQSPFDSRASQDRPALTVLSSNATKAVVEALMPQLETAAGRKLQVTFGNSADLKTRIEKGDVFDAAILTQALIDELAASGKLVPASRAAVARAGVGVTVKKGAPLPDVSTPAALKKAIVNAKSITYVGQGATAPILRKMFADFGLTEAVNAKTKLVLNAGEAVAAGEAELGFTQISEILNIPGVVLAGPLPPSLQVYTSFGAAVSANARDAAVAASVIRVLTSQAASAVITAKGMQPAAAPDRLPPISVSQMTDAQKKAAEEFKVIRNGAEVSGPFFPLLRSPELMVRASAMGEYLRYRSSLPPRLSEFVILLTAREWTQQYEWNAHYPIALKAGISLPIAAAIAEGRRPDGMDAEQEALYDLVQDLIKNKSVSDPVYQRALAKFGEPGVVDTVGIVGYYSMLAMVMNTARTPGGDSTAPVLQPIRK